MSDQRLGVIDVGSNSGRIVVIRLGPEGHLEVLADSRAPLRLARDLQRGAQLTRETIDRTAAALRDFRAVAESAGAPRMVAVATAAVREAENGAELIDRIQRQGGVEVRVISGEAEA
ncbi:MAG TPA: exopolyphosphatase, partial [Actinomycetota bacterium]|nr:exopolyphosphatase [Actinomycetota bacterium]